MNFLIIVLLLVVIWGIYRKGTERTPQKMIPALRDKFVKRVYCGETGEALVSYKYKIAAKPDFIYRLPDDEYIIVEYKSRKGVVQESDIVQLIASAVAAKHRYPKLNKGYVYTRSGNLKFVDLTRTEDDLVRTISDEIKATRISVSKSQPSFTPKKEKCRVCGFRGGCDQKKRAI